jgi:hypothetical protein
LCRHHLVAVLLTRHGEVHPVLACDHVVAIVVAEIDLHPIDFTAELVVGVGDLR